MVVLAMVEASDVGVPVYRRLGFEKVDSDANVGNKEIRSEASTIHYTLAEVHSTKHKKAALPGYTS